MYEEMLAGHGLAHWRAMIDPMNPGGYVIYDDKNFIRAVAAVSDGPGWQVQVIFLERIQSYDGMVTSASALDFALGQIAEERNEP